MKRKLLSALSVVVLGTFLVACGTDPQDTGTEPSGTQVPTSDPTPDVDGVPDVVAEVNGDAIDRNEFVARYTASYPQRLSTAHGKGEDVDQVRWRHEVLETMIDTTLLTQDARGRGLSVTDADVDDFLQAQAAAENLDSVDDLLDEYEEQGRSEEYVRTDAETQLLINGLVHNYLHVAEPSEQDLEALYEAMGYTDANEDVEVPSLESIRPELQYQARNANRQTAIGEHVTELRAHAVVTHFLDTGGSTEAGWDEADEDHTEPFDGEPFGPNPHRDAHHDASAGTGQDDDGESGSGDPAPGDGDDQGAGSTGDDEGAGSNQGGDNQGEDDPGDADQGDDNQGGNDHGENNPGGDDSSEGGTAESDDSGSSNPGSDDSGAGDDSGSDGQGDGSSGSDGSGSGGSGSDGSDSGRDSATNGDRSDRGITGGNGSGSNGSTPEDADDDEDGSEASE